MGIENGPQNDKSSKVKKFFKGIKEVGRKGLLASVVGASALAGAGVEQANAQEHKTVDKQHQQLSQEKQGPQIDESKLTESSKWSREIVNSAKADLKNIKTQEDANWLIRSYFGPFVAEYYTPTKGNLKEGAYGTKTREYSKEDLIFLLQQAKVMKQIVEELNAKFGVEAYGDRISEIDGLIGKLESRSSYAGQAQERMLKNALEKYQ
jgi:hypothetical protein